MDDPTKFNFENPPIPRTLPFAKLAATNPVPKIDGGKVCYDPVAAVSVDVDNASVRLKLVREGVAAYVATVTVAGRKREFIVGAAGELLAVEKSLDSWLGETAGAAAFKHVVIAFATSLLKSVGV